MPRAQERPGSKVREAGSERQALFAKEQPGTGTKREGVADREIEGGSSMKYWKPYYIHVINFTRIETLYKTFNRRLWFGLEYHRHYIFTIFQEYLMFYLIYEWF